MGDAMVCDPVVVTGYVDGELGEPFASAVERHLALCRGCAAQAASENDLRSRLLRLPQAQPWPGLGARLRASMSGAMLGAAN
jgi:anti-sigma factor RsiW